MVLKELDKGGVRFSAEKALVCAITLEQFADWKWTFYLERGFDPSYI